MARGHKGNRLTRQDDEMIAQMHRMGKSVSEIADFTGYSRPTISAHLAAMGFVGDANGRDDGEVLKVLRSIDEHLAGIGDALMAMATNGCESCDGGDAE